MRVVAINISEDGENYSIENDIPTSGYTFNKEKSVCKVSTEESGIENAPIDNNITIEYEDGKVNFLGVSKRNTRCYLYFDKIIKPPELSSGDRIEDLEIIVNEGTPDFSQSAKTDEGVFKVEDGMYGGTSYYWRGAVTNNYVKFTNKCWRIVRINGDGSIRLIYDGNTCHANGTSTSDSIALASQTYNSLRNNSSYVGWTYAVGSQRPTDNNTAIASNAKTQLESWFTSNITGTDLEKVADGKYCNDRTVGSGTWSAKGSTFYYAASERLETNKTPTLSCDSGDIYTLKAGLITADEVSYAGGLCGASNSNNSYYLRNGQDYWTMSPRYWDGYGCYTRVFIVYSSGNIDYNDVDNTTRGLRPVINLRSDITFSGGIGTLDDPYIVAD